MNEDYMRKICNANRKYLGKENIPETFAYDKELYDSAYDIIMEIDFGGSPKKVAHERMLAVHRVISLIENEIYAQETDKQDMKQDYVALCVDFRKARQTIEEMKYKLAEAEKIIEHNDVSMRNAREHYIGMDGFHPMTAAEAYCLRIIEQMYAELCDKPGGDNA